MASGLNSVPGLQKFLQDINSGTTLLSQSTGISKVTNGWWLFIALVGGIALAGTPVAPLVVGIFTVALIYQSINLVQGT